MKIVWLSSMNDRGNVTMVHGGIYETDDFERKVHPATLAAWLEEGAAEEYDPAKHDKKEEPEPEPETASAPEEPVKVDKSPEFADEPKPTPEPTPAPAEEDKADEEKADEETTPAVEEKKPAETSILKDDDKFPCTHEDCEKHKDPYTASHYFIKHMKSKHGEDWVKEGDKIMKKA